MSQPTKESMEFTAITRLRHAALWEMSKRLGGQRFAAEQCFVTHLVFNRWVVLKASFPASPTNRWWSESRWNKTKEALESLTGQSLEQLWPQSLRNVISTHKLLTTIEQVIEVPEEALIAYAEHTAERLRLPEPILSAENEELKTALTKAVKKLSSREREVIKLWYGLGDDYTYDLEEVGHIFKVSKERVRQIEAKAIRKLGPMPELQGFK